MKFKQKVFLIFNALFHCLPMKTQILFVCFEGRQYGDNPRYIADYIHKVEPQIKLYWVVDKKVKEKNIPDYLKQVKNNTIKYAWIKNRSRIIVSNGAGVMLSVLSGGKKAYARFIKKKKQSEIATWHGTPLKHIGSDIPGSGYTEENLYSSANVIIASSEYEKMVFERAFLNKIPVDILGYARNDILFRSADKTALKKKLGIPSNKNVILYAPTYRDGDVALSGLSQLDMLDSKELFQVLKAKFGGEWVLVYRFHNLVCHSTQIQKYMGKESFIDGNKSDDMADYLSIADILITDYSGSLFDVAGSRIKCFLFAPDLYEYENTRGMYMKISDLPYSVALSFQQLIENIHSFEEESYDVQVNNFTDRIGALNDGKATKRIYEKYIRDNLR